MTLSKHIALTTYEPFKSLTAYLESGKFNLEVLQLFIDSGIKDLTPSDNKGWNSVITAVMKGHYDAIPLLVKAGAVIDYQEENKSSALHYAVRMNHPGAVPYLLDAGINRDTTDAWGYTAFQRTCCRDELHIEALKAFVARESAGDGLLPEQGGQTMAHFAVMKQSTEAITELRKAGISVDTPCKDGWTPLHSAAFEGFYACADVLIGAGSKVIAETNGKKTPYALAAEKNNVPIMWLLRLHTSLVVDETSLVNKETGKLISEADNPSFLQTCSAEKIDISSLQGFANAGLQHDCRIPGPGQHTMAHYAAEHNVVPAFSLLKQIGVDLNQGCKDGWRPAHTAAWLGHSDAINELVRLGADMSLRNNAGQTPMECAASRQMGVYTNFQHACCPENLDIKKLEMFAKNGFKNDGALPGRAHTMLHYAVVHKSTRAVDALVHMGVPINKGCQDNWTALHFAAQTGAVDCARRLLELGADRSIKNNNGQNTPLDLARGQHNQAMIELFTKE